MDLAKFISAFKAAFPSQPIYVEDSAAIVPCPCKEIGQFAVYDHDEELTVYVGEFTHGHFSSYDDSLTPEQAEAEIITELIEFFGDTFADQVEFYWNDFGAGGWRPAGTGPGRSVTWSGKVLHSAS